MCFNSREFTPHSSHHFITFALLYYILKATCSGSLAFTYEDCKNSVMLLGTSV